MQETLPQLQELPPMPVGRKPSMGSVPVSALLTVDQVAEKLGVARTTVYLRIKDCRFHPIRQGRNIFIHPDEVENELQRVEQFHTEKPGRISRRSAITYNPSEETKNKLYSAPSPALTSSVPSFSASSISNLEPPAQYTGEQAAKAIVLFRAGKGQLEIIEEMNIGFELARYFWICYVEAQPSWLLPPKQLAQVRTLIGWQDDPPSPENFQKALHKFIAKQIEREASASVKKQIGGEELSPEEKAVLSEADAEAVTRAEMRAKATAAADTAKAATVTAMATSAQPPQVLIKSLI
jgi:hypothetical protein